MMLKFIYLLFFSVLFFMSCGPKEAGKEKNISQNNVKHISKEEGSVTKDETTTEVTNLSPPSEAPPVPPSAELPIPSPEGPSVAAVENLIDHTIHSNWKNISSECNDYFLEKLTIFSLRWTFDSKGYPKNIVVAENKKGNTEFVNCVIKELETIQFYNVPENYHKIYKFWITVGEIVQA